MEHRLKTPLSEKDVRALRAGDLVWLNGIVYTARDKVHSLLHEGLPVDLKGAVIYHSGPLISDDKVISAGPTTSSRMARYTEAVVSSGVKMIIGKGGIPGAAEALSGKCVYLAYPGGCGALAARQLKVKDVHLKDLGMAEALWVLKATDFGPMIVAIDSHGRDLYEEVRRSVKTRL
jgi:fumarate hydratase subunit beta